MCSRTPSLQVLLQLIPVAMCVLPMAVQPIEVELRYGILTSGTRCVMMRGVAMMQQLYAGNLDTEEQP